VQSNVLSYLSDTHQPARALAAAKGRGAGPQCHSARAGLCSRNEGVHVQELLASTNEFDASGNPKLGDIGMHMKKLLKQYFERVDIKYIDPTYMIRAIATTSPDRVYCKVLAHNAVHGAFAGFTGAYAVRAKAIG
jgi:6-phosphofructokinase